MHTSGRDSPLFLLQVLPAVFDLVFLAGFKFDGNACVVKEFEVLEWFVKGVPLWSWLFRVEGGLEVPFCDGGH